MKIDVKEPLGNNIDETDFDRAGIVSGFPSFVYAPDYVRPNTDGGKKRPMVRAGFVGIGVLAAILIASQAFATEWTIQDENGDWIKNPHCKDKYCAPIIDEPKAQEIESGPMSVMAERDFCCISATYLDEKGAGKVLCSDVTMRPKLDELKACPGPWWHPALSTKDYFRALFLGDKIVVK